MYARAYISFGPREYRMHYSGTRRLAAPTVRDRLCISADEENRAVNISARRSERVPDLYSLITTTRRRYNCLSRTGSSFFFWDFSWHHAAPASLIYQLSRCNAGMSMSMHAVVTQSESADGNDGLLKTRYTPNMKLDLFKNIFFSRYDANRTLTSTLLAFAIYLCTNSNSDSHRLFVVPVLEHGLFEARLRCTLRAHTCHRSSVSTA